MIAMVMKNYEMGRCDAHSDDTLIMTSAWQ